MDAVTEYRERRRKRLDERAVSEYLNRREERIRKRLDDEEETNNGGRKGGHGNTRIPYGLCQREGIQIDPKWTPSDAWSALEGKGYKVGEVYQELKKTGRVASRTPKTKLTESNFPPAMVSKTYRKNTMEFVSYINEHCNDQMVSKMLSLGTSLKGKTLGNVSCKRTNATGGSRVATAVDRRTRLPVETTITIPNFSKIKDDGLRKHAANVFAHEWTHYMDLMARNNDEYGHFTSGDNELKNAIDKDDGSVGKEVKELFDRFNTETLRLDKEEKQVRGNRVKKAVAEQFFGGKESGLDWITDDGNVEWSRFYGYMRTLPDYDRKEATRIAYDVDKSVRKIWRECEEEYNDKVRTCISGVDALQGLYDSINGGKLRASGDVRFGHSLSYFRSEPNNKAIEALASYVSLKVTNPELADMFDRDKPEIAKYLNNTIDGIIKRLG